MTSNDAMIGATTNCLGNCRLPSYPIANGVKLKDTDAGIYSGGSALLRAALAR